MWSDSDDDLSPETTWADLEQGIHQVFRRVGMEPNRYMQLYTLVFNICSAPTISQIDWGPNATRVYGSDPLKSDDSVGRDLYDKLANIVRGYVVAIKEKGKIITGDDLLKYYAKEWTDFCFSARVVDGLFSYQNRNWIQRQREEGDKTIFSTYAKCLAIWREEYFMLVKDRLTDGVLQLIRKERCGETIDRQLVKEIVNSFLDLGVETGPSEEEESSLPTCVVEALKQTSLLLIYKTHFEAQFLQETEVFFGHEAQVFLSQNSLTDYMKKVEARMDEEHERCELLLNMFTQSKLSRSLEKVLIANHLEAFQAEFRQLLDKEMDDDLARMYKLCRLVDSGLNRLRPFLEDHVRRQGLAAIERIDEKSQQDARVYISTILGVHSRYSGLVQYAFRNEPGFVQSFDKAVNTFINSNVITKKNGTGASKSAELLARYCDFLLRKSKKMPEESELEEMLNKVSLGKRLIHDTSSSEDAEISLINKLKQSCGFEYASKMSRMINDVQVSKTLSSEYQTQAKESGKAAVDFQILVLSTGSWPSMSVTNFVLPASLEGCVEEFKKYYDSRHNGRKLTWVLTQSRGELVCNAFTQAKVFIASTAQICVLNLFNDALEFDVQSVEDNLKMDKRLTCATIMSLIKADILIGPNVPDSGEYEGSVKVELNMKYSNNKYKVDLTKLAQMRVITKQERENVQKDVDEDRKSIISACIVRIMKMRKSLQHSQLIAEVIQQLSHRFNPKVELIKGCISQLIDKDYIKRDEAQRDIYEYIA